MAGLVSLLRSIPLSPIASRALSLSSASPLLRLRPLVAAVLVGFSLRRNPVRSGLRCFSTRPTISSLNNPSPNWSTGCGFERWLVFRESPDPSDPSLTRDELIHSFVLDEPTDHSLILDIIDKYIEAEGLGSEEEARMSIYSVSTKHYFAFGCKVSEEISYKIKPLQKVRWVLPDSYLDVKNKDYGGEPFIDGKAVPYDPKYHEEWVRNNARAQERSRRNDRPRNFDRSRNFERRRENMQNFQNREAPPVQNQEFPSQNTTQHTSQGTPPVREGATPNFQNQPPPNYQNQMPPNSTAVPNQQGGYVPNYQGGSRGYQGGPRGPGYQGDQEYQSGFPRSNIPGGGFGSNGSSPHYPGGNVTGSSPGYPRGNPAGPPTGYQVNPGGYQGGNSATPPTYQGDSSARPGSHTGYQGGNPSDYQGGGPPPTAYPGGYQGGAPAYQGGSPVGRQVFNQPFQGQGVSSGYPPPNSRNQGGSQNNQQGGEGYQGGSQNNQQGGEGYQGGAPVYPGRDLPGRDQ